jgi:septal ring factor EnvC (AmiA/AmiB activator)
MEFNWIPIAISAVIALISYFLKQTMERLKETEKMTIENKAKIDLVENNHSHLNAKVDMLHDAIKDLTTEIKNLAKEVSKKKDF